MAEEDEEAPLKRWWFAPSLTKAPSDGDQGSPSVAEALAHPEPVFVRLHMTISEF